MRDFAIGIYEKAFPETLDVSEMLLLAKEYGYDFFEISIDKTDLRIARLYSDIFADEIAVASKKAGVVVETIVLSALGTYTLGNPSKEIREKAKDIFSHSLLFAKKIGARFIQIPACDVPKFDSRDEVTHNLYLNNLSEMVRLASKEGVIIALENMENDYADTIEKCCKILEAINSPYLQLYPDSGNITSAAIIYDIDPLKDLEKGSGRIVSLHIKETKPNKYGGLFYGEGHVDFNRIINGAYHIGLRRFSMEYWQLESRDWKRDLKDARELCLRYLEACQND